MERCSKCTCPSYGGLSEWLQCGDMEPAWAAGEMLQLHYLWPVLEPQVMCGSAVSLCDKKGMLDEGFICEAWWGLGRIGGENPVISCNCLKYWIAVCWTALNFVRFIAQNSRSHDQSEDYSKYIVFFVSNFPHETNLASSFGLVTVFITMIFLLIFFSTAMILSFNIYLLIVSE